MRQLHNSLWWETKHDRTLWQELELTRTNKNKHVILNNLNHKFEICRLGPSRLSVVKARETWVMFVGNHALATMSTQDAHDTEQSILMTTN